MPLAALVALALAIPGPAGPVAFTTVLRGSDSHVEEAKTAVVLLPAQWTALWKQHAPGTPAPRVDFVKDMVVGVFLGSRPTGGYSVTITAIEEKGTELIVTYREEQPAPGTMVTQALTSPLHLVRLPQHRGPIRFERATATGEPRR